MGKDKLTIGVTCYPTFGGSGVVATEVGMAMARRGHKVHFISYDVPRRLERFTERVYFHEVELVENPLFLHPPYTLALASKMVDVATYHELDVMHVHYAVPHATSAYLAKQIMGDKAPKVITTLHGTDITLVGSERTYLPITRFSILQSDAVTTPSKFLKAATYDKLNVPTSCNIDVIGNFVDSEKYAPRNGDCNGDVKGCLKIGTNERILVHVSNFRPVKRIDDVVKIFDRVLKLVPSRLVLVGDGPERAKIESLVRELGLTEKVFFLGKQESTADLLRCCDIFLLPSSNESFGLAALEAMACGLPVVASRTEGIPEVVTHGKNGFLSSVGDVDEMAASVVQLLTDDAMYTEFSKEARRIAVEQFSRETLVEQYENLYYRVLK